MQAQSFDGHEAYRARICGIRDVVDTQTCGAIRIPPLRQRFVRDEVELFGNQQQIAESLEMQRPRARMNGEEAHGRGLARIADVHDGSAAAAEGMTDEGVSLVDHDLYAVGSAAKV
jgi:hypothetical protein